MKHKAKDKIKNVQLSLSFTVKMYFLPIIYKTRSSIDPVVVNKKASLIYAFVIFKIKSTFLTYEKINHRYQNRS